MQMGILSFCNLDSNIALLWMKMGLLLLWLKMGLVRCSVFEGVNGSA